MTEDRLSAEYASPADPAFVVRYRARCHCGTVRYEVCAEPLDAKLCHCRDCQVLHGAPMQWAAIFRKADVRISAGLSELEFYNASRAVSARALSERVLPCKVRCGRCGTPVADEGRTMWLAFPSLFEFGTPPTVPPAFQPSCHIFYASRTMEVQDELPKWSGHRDRSQML